MYFHIKKDTQARILRIVCLTKLFYQGDLFYKPKIPYQRLLDPETLTDYERERLAETFNSLNPIELRKYLSFQLMRFKRIFEGVIDYRYSFTS